MVLKCLRTALAACLLIGLNAAGAATGEAPDTRPASLSLFNREVITFRVPLLGVSPQERSHRAAVRIQELMEAGGHLQLSLQSIAQGALVQLEGKVVFIVTPEDADVLRQESSTDAAQGAVVALQRVIGESREYRVVCQALPSEPRPRAEVLSALHANIQDVFNEYSVQIMSPHYLGDPASAKVVPREGWSPAPAKSPGI